MTNLDKLQQRRQVLYVKKKVSDILKGYVFKTVDSLTMSACFDEICEFMESIKELNTINDYDVYVGQQFVLWGMIGDEYVNPNNPDSKLVVICRGGQVYDIEKECFVVGESNDSLKSEINGALENFDLEISSKVDNSKLCCTVYIKPINCPSNIGISFNVKNK